MYSWIAAVVVHAEPTKTGDEVSALSRVRIIAGASELFVVATNLTTSALAALTIVEDSRAERFGADLAALVATRQAEARAAAADAPAADEDDEYDDEDEWN